MEEYIYLDNAATTFPKPEAVYQALDRANRNAAVNAGRGSYALAEQAKQLIEDTRGLLLTLTKAKPAAEVVFTPSATFACNQIFGGLPWKREDIVYVSPYEHNAVMRTLHFLQQRYGFAIEELSVDAGTLELDLEKIRYQFIQNPPTVLAMTHISNVTGYILPVEEVAALTDTEKTTVIVDGSQALGLIPVRLEQSGIDYYIFAGHKTLYGPFGVGGYIAQSTGNAEKLGLVIAGGTGSNSLNLEMPQLLPDRYEPGSPNVPAIAGLKAAIETFGSNYEEMCQTIEEHYQKERELTELLETELQKIQGVHTYFPQDKEKRNGICSFTIEGYSSDDVGMLLDEDYHIAVRCGYHCAPLIHKYLKDEPYGGTVRVGIGQFNTKEDIRQLIHAVEEIARG